ncbi:alpha/beta hydrolase family protein [Pseudonocardia charpentierae]|uniref:Prolyl aminopeptidase n=1 Tax=Pseudonocardia charpentierae TaxID=3075545 RepID=A0ABU2NGH0_9PSEU|nr:hypothetical protein [Pseudonocardia sp. DSM 45834]MDT0353055.1 hypothetical protein [Pseudonocardia sp. DSM 45834]
MTVDFSLAPGHRPDPRYDDPHFRYLFARLVTHYWRHAAFLGNDQLIQNAGILNGTLGVLVHGRYYVSGPLETAWRLHQGWSTSALRIVDDAGHRGGSMSRAVFETVGRSRPRSPDQHASRHLRRRFTPLSTRGPGR